VLAPIDLPDAQLAYDPCWLDPGAADALFTVLHADIAWETHRLRLFGREIDAPRLSCWIGDPGANYTYSRVRFEPRPWPDALTSVRKRLHDQFGAPFNSVLANRYRDGRDSMGWHSDDEPELGPEPVIASLSLGTTRRFVLRHRQDKAQKFALDLGHGSLLTMGGATQRYWQHALPRSMRVSGERINLTFRCIHAPNDAPDRRAATAASGPRHSG
jgi:alkylated DNA repair dioxygenase AlkB